MNKKMQILAIMFLSIVTFVTANGVGNEIEKTVNGISFEFGIEPKEIKANKKAIMSLSIHNASTGEALKIDNLWIRISKGNEILFTSSDFRIPQEGPMFFGYLFKEGGSYMIDFSAKYDGKERKIGFGVEVGGDNKSVSNFAALAGIFVLGYLTALVFNKLRRKKDR